MTPTMQMCVRYLGILNSVIQFERQGKFCMCCPNPVKQTNKQQKTKKQLLGPVSLDFSFNIFFS